MLTGPVDIPGLLTGTDLGNVSLEPKYLPRGARGLFGQRVSDGAANAVATLELTLGARVVVIQRALSDLALRQLSVDAVEAAIGESESFQPCIQTLATVGSFADWILLLRYLVFYFEDRRELIWDVSAQRQLLRLLLLEPDVAQRWAVDERKILERDSRVRNLSFALFREEQALATTEQKIETAGDVRAELAVLEDLQRTDVDRREKLDNEVVSAQAQREAARLRSLQMEQEREARYRNLERAKLSAIELSFPKRSDTARYILAQLMSEGVCLVCGTSVPLVAQSLSERVDHSQCVVCGTSLSDSSGKVISVKLVGRRIKKAAGLLDAIDDELTSARKNLEDAESSYRSLTTEISALDAAVSERSRKIDSLVVRLPPGEADVHQQRQELATMRGRLEVLKTELEDWRAAFGTLIENENRKMVKRSGAIKGSFGQYAKGFLLEKAVLIWSPKGARVGQTGALIEFPAFELEMTGADFQTAVRRSGPDQVSESQREFIDLAFRMALMEVAGAKHVGSLVIDAPESSLDAVFVARAASVLARFAAPERKNRLLVTSNLSEGGLVRRLLELSAKVGDRLNRLVNLFDIAEPTAAIRELRGDYERVLRRLLRGIDKKTVGSRVSTTRRQ